MKFAAVSSVLLCLQCHTLVSLPTLPLHYTDRQNGINMGVFNGERFERAVVNVKRLTKMGFTVVKTLLKDATPVQSSSEFRRKYIKSGGVKQMLSDFNNFYYDDVTKYNSPNGVAGRVGKVADRVILVRSKGENGKPTLEILKVKDKVQRKLTGRQFDLVRDEITYLD